MPLLMSGPSRLMTTKISAWYRAGGAPAPLAAYAAKGAASLAASYVNLVTPGTYDLTAETAPSWAAATGWDCTLGARLTVALTPAAEWTALVRIVCTGAGQGSAGRAFEDAGGVWGITPYSRTYKNGGTMVASGGSANFSGVDGFAGQTGYRDGVSQGSIPTGTGYGAGIAILSRYTTTVRSMAGQVLAFAVWNSTLTPTQITALSTAMNAL